MSRKCEVCGKYLKNNRGYNIHYERMHGKKEVVNDDVLDDLMNRLRKIELDNVFLKHQLKLIASSDYNVILHEEMSILVRNIAERYEGDKVNTVSLRIYDHITQNNGR